MESGIINAHNLLIYINNISNTLPDLGKEKVAGSNPAQGFDSSLRVPSNKIAEKLETISSSAHIISKGNRSRSAYSIPRFEMRDLYNRKNRLNYWLVRIQTDLERNDKLIYIYTQFNNNGT